MRHHISEPANPNSATAVTVSVVALSRRTHAIVVGSAGLHALVIALIARCSIERPEREHLVGSAPRVEVAPAELAMGIQLVTLPPALDPASLLEPGSMLEPATTPSSGRRGAAIASGTRGSGTSREPGRGSGTESMRMRGRRHDLSLSGDVLDRLLANTKPLVAIATDERLRPKGGEHVIVDRVTTVMVGKDGSARFADQKDIDVKLKLPIMTFDQFRRGLGNMLTKWRDDPWGDQRAGHIEDKPRHITAVEGACNSVGDSWCDSVDDRPSKSLSKDASIIPVVGGKLDITSYLHRKFIGDPYASRKLKLLDTTRDARAQIGSTHRAEQRDRASELAQRNVQALWQATVDPAQRREALFAMWDECVETEDADGEAGERARAIVMGWIRAKLPAGSPGAFSTDEIAKLDAARTSRQHFAPY